MSGPLLGTFSIEGLRPLGSPAQRSFELVHATVTDLLDRAHADVFAEPMAARHGNQIDWYATMDGTPVPAAGLSGAERQALLALLDSRLHPLSESAA